MEDLTEEQYDKLSIRVERLHRIEDFTKTDEYILGLSDAEFENYYAQQEKLRKDEREAILEARVREEEQDKQRRLAEKKDAEAKRAEGIRLAREAEERQQGNKKYHDSDIQTPQ